MYAVSTREYTNEINSIFELNSKTHTATIIDVTFWDELVNFVKTKDKAWYKEFVESQFETYEADYIGIYDLDAKCLIKTSSARLDSIGAIPAAVRDSLYKTKLVRYYQKVPEGILEIFGATIHPSDDPKKDKHKPSGYFFMARLLEKNFIQNLEKFTSSIIHLEPAGVIDNEVKNRITIGLNLNDIKGKAIATLKFERPFNVNFNNTKKILGIIVLGTIFNLLVYLYYYRRWVYKPISLITKILETKNESLVAELGTLRGEFEHIGNLFKEKHEQRRQLEIAKQKAEESDKLKSAFLANLSHEIRTPMNAIMGFSDLLTDPNLPESERINYLKIINNSGKNLTSIIEDLIEMSKIDSKQITPNFRPLDLDKCLSDLYQALKVTIADQSEIEFAVVKKGKSLATRILTDETKLKQILTNLITNAIKFTKSGRIEMGYILDEVNDLIEIFVTDTGKGISKANLSVIFDRFRRIEDESSINISGLGLGLSITKAYVNLLGGQIDVKSELDKGSTFSFTIPLTYAAEEPVVSVESKANKTIQTGQRTILIAEDDDINFKLIEKILALRTYKVLRAVNGFEAVSMTNSIEDIDLIFMDIKMPVMDGFTALTEIRKFNTTIPVVANTAYSSSEDKEQIKNAGFTSYISKPLNKSQVFELMDTIFGVN